MKKLLLVFVAVLTLAVLVPEVDASVGQDIENFHQGLLEMVGQRGAVPDGGFILPCPNEFNEIGDYHSARKYIIQVLNFALSFLGLIAMLFIIYAGFMYVTAGGDDGQHEKAKKIVVYAAAGILVVLISFALVNTLIRSAPTGDDDRGGVGGATFSGEGTMVPDYCRQLDGDGGPDVTEIEIAVTPGDSFGMGYMVSLSEGALTFTTSKNGEWNFGDGMTGLGSSVTHTYGERGAYEVYFLAEEGGQFYGAKTVIVVDGVMADFKANNNSPIVGEAVTFDGRASKSAVGSLTTYAWTCLPAFTNQNPLSCDWPNLYPYPGDVITADFPGSGEYNVKLTVTNNIEATGSITKTFTVIGDKPTAFISSVELAERNHHPAEYVFDAAGSMNIHGTPAGLRYVWDFGDGEPEQTVTSQTVTHEYDIPGDMDVILKTQYSHNGTWLESEELELLVEDVTTLWADFMAPTFLTVGQEFSFQEQSSEGATYGWTFPTEATTLDPLDFPVVRAFFATAGTYNIQLVVTKETNGVTETETITKTVFVREEGEPMAVIQYDGGGWINLVPPILDTTRNSNGVTILSLQSASSDEVGNMGCANAQLNYSWSVSGVPVSTECDPSSSINPLLTEAKLYPITLTVYRPGNQNVNDSTFFQANVVNIDPEIANITYETNTTPTPPPAGSVNFSVNAVASDPDTTSGIVSYFFEAIENGVVKDAQLLTTGEASFDLSQYAGVHTFSFRVTATDVDNGSTIEFNSANTYTFENIIVNTSPVITSFSADQTGVAVGESVRFDVTATDAEGDTLTYKWSVSKDGQPSVLHDTGTESFYIHYFTESGVYEAHVRVSDGVNPDVVSNNAIMINVVP